MILRINDRIRNRKVDFFNQFNLSLKYDSVNSAFSFNFYFDPDNPEHKEMMCIGHFHECTLEHNGELLLTGYILSQGFSSAPQRKMVSIGGYTKTGVLDDCNIPTSVYPLQSDNLSLREIASKLIAPFKLSMVVDSEVSGEVNKVYPNIIAEPSDTITGYLAQLASQRNITLSHNEKGNLVFTKAKTNKKPLMDFDVSSGGIIGTSMQLVFNGQAMHSHITVMKQADKEGGNAGETTIINPYVPFVFRPKTITQSSGNDIDTEQAARNALSEELKNLTLKITTDRWEVDGKIIKPNNLITVRNPDIYLYKKSTWFIESIDFTGDNVQNTAVLNCVLPEVYNSRTPEYLFKGINLH